MNTNITAGSSQDNPVATAMALMDQSRNMMVLTNADLIIVFANTVARNHYGHDDANPVVGCSLLDFHDQDFGKRLQNLRDMFMNRSVSTFEASLPIDGVNHKFSYIPVFDDASGQEVFTGILEMQVLEEAQ